MELPSNLQNATVDHNKVSILLVWHFSANSKSLEQFTNLKAIVRYGVGFDNIDLDYCGSKNIKVYNNPDYGVDKVTMHVLLF